METIKNFFFDNFTIVTLVVVMVLASLVILILFLFKSIKISDIKNQILLAMLNDSLEDFLELTTNTIKGTFDQFYEIKKATSFLVQHLNPKTSKKIIQIFNNLDGSGRSETAVVFRRAFLQKSMFFWVDVYVAYIYPAEDQETCRTLNDLFDVLYKREDRNNLWRLIYQKLYLIEHDAETDSESAESLREEQWKISEILRSKPEVSL